MAPAALASRTRASAVWASASMRRYAPLQVGLRVDYLDYSPASPFVKS